MYCKDLKRVMEGGGVENGVEREGSNERVRESQWKKR